MQAKLIESKEIGTGIRHFVFEAVGVDQLEFAPGQFVSLTHEIKGKKITRAYSIASEPGHTSRFELCLNQVADGHFSPYLFAMHPGDAVEMRPPLGTFMLKPDLREIVMIATGTGIAPFRSMLRTYLPAGLPQTTLLFGVRHEHNLLYRGEFEEMAARFPGFQFWPTLTRPESGWRGRTGRVQEHVTEALAGRIDVDVFLCGLKEMVDEVRALLKATGLDRKQIHYEKYD